MSYKICQKLYKIDIPKKRLRDDKINKILINILDSIYFEVVIIVCIIANLFILMMNYSRQSKISKNYFRSSFKNICL